jgi:hypothetical protein
VIHVSAKANAIEEYKARKAIKKILFQLQIQQSIGLGANNVSLAIQRRRLAFVESAHGTRPTAEKSPAEWLPLFGIPERVKEPMPYGTVKKCGWAKAVMASKFSLPSAVGKISSKEREDNLRAHLPPLAPLGVERIIEAIALQ